MNRAELQELLQAAVELELAVIPPYLCAMYSIRPNSNNEAQQVIRSVVVEEMLHLVLAANVLNAIGGRPRVIGQHAPRYPHELPDGVVVELLPFSPPAIDTFLKIENPQYDHRATDAHAALLEGRRPTLHPARVKQLAYPTVGAFYAAVGKGLTEAAEQIGEHELFCGDIDRQIGGEYYYAGGGGAIIVDSLSTALAALDEIVEQGEGDMHSMFDGDGDLAHYFRFQEIKWGRRYLPSDNAGEPTGAVLAIDYAQVYPMIANPRLDDFTDPELRAAAAGFNDVWSELLSQIDAAFDGQPASLIPAVQTMWRLRDQAAALLANPLGDADDRHAGPPFDCTAPAEDLPSSTVQHAAL